MRITAWRKFGYEFFGSFVATRVPLCVTAFAKRSISSASILPVILCQTHPRSDSPAGPRWRRAAYDISSDRQDAGPAGTRLGKHGH